MIFACIIHWLTTLHQWLAALGSLYQPLFHSGWQLLSWADNYCLRLLIIDVRPLINHALKNHVIALFYSYMTFTIRYVLRHLGATCSIDDFPSAGFQNIATVAPSGVPINYGDSVTLMCNVPGMEPFNKSRTCVYDVYTQTYKLLGDSMECGCKLKHWHYAFHFYFVLIEAWKCTY